jgi:uncharacterized damage-inducible protein DinB
MPGNVPPVANEREGLLAFLAQQRYVLTLAAYGLTDEQARMTPSSSQLSVGGLVRHVTATERAWMDRAMLRPVRGQGVDEYVSHFRMSQDQTLSGLLADYEAAARETEADVAQVPDLGRPVPVPRDAPWFPQDVDAWSVRWVLLHVIEETARHAGHADIIRESIDGATAFPLMAAAEGWPATEWLQPWTPSS